MLINYQKEVLIDHRSTVSIVDQVYEQLEILFSSAKVMNDQEIISAKKLAHLLDIDVADVDNVYDKLLKNKFIYVTKEHNIRVSKYNRILDFFKKIVYFVDGIKQLNKEPSIEVLDFEIIKANEDMIPDINVYQDKRFLKQTRLFKADNEPYIYLEEFYSVERFPKLLDAKPDIAGFTYEKLLSVHYDIQFKKNERLVKVQIIDQKLANILKVKKGLPNFRIDMIYYDQDNIPIGYAIIHSLPYFYFDYNIKIK